MPLVKIAADHSHTMAPGIVTLVFGFATTNPRVYLRELDEDFQISASDVARSWQDLFQPTVALQDAVSLVGPPVDRGLEDEPCYAWQGLLREWASVQTLWSPHDLAGHNIAITQEAEAYARSHGLKHTLLKITTIIREVIPTAKELRVDFKEDPEEQTLGTICFTMTVSEPVHRMLQLDDQLQDVLYERIEPNDRPSFSFAYSFE